MNYNIISYANAGCELGGSNAARGGFTQHFNSSAVRSHTEPLKKMFHKFVLFCLCCWSLTGKLQKKKKKKKEIYIYINIYILGFFFLFLLFISKYFCSYHKHLQMSWKLYRELYSAWKTIQ